MNSLDLFVLGNDLSESPKVRTISFLTFADSTNQLLLGNLLLLDYVFEPIFLGDVILKLIHPLLDLHSDLALNPLLEVDLSVLVFFHSFDSAVRFHGSVGLAYLRCHPL